MNQQEIIVANKATAHETDWVKEERLIELRAEELLAPAPKRPHYYRENYPGEELSEVERENVEASRNN